MLMRTTKSLCPVCAVVLPADIIEEDQKIWIVRSCPEHGTFRDLYWSDSEMYRRFSSFESTGRGIENPQRNADPNECPGACGLCNNHKSGTLLANIDLTNRCNLNCDFCFANARACGYLYEPSFNQIVDMMKMLRRERPVAAPAVQFSGGEPTIRDDLIDIIRKAKELGFAQVQLATNGIRLAKEPEFVTELKDAGLSTLYLHFDGVTRKTNPHITMHRRAVETCCDIGMGLVLVPTVINGRNDGEVGAIIQYAADHIEGVRGVNFQPVAFTGAASEDDVARERVTIPDLIDRIELQTDGVIQKDYFFPVPCVTSISDLVEAYTGRPQLRFTAHQHCGAATYAFVTDEGLIPINKMVDVEGFFEAISGMAEQLKQGGSLNKYRTLIEGVKNMHASVKQGEYGNAAQFWRLLGSTLVQHDFTALKDFHWNALFIGTMHFMDRYNFDLSRVQRCCIHYATPDGRLIPFCTYNSGPVHREEVWRKFSTTLSPDE